MPCTISLIRGAAGALESNRELESVAVVRQHVSGGFGWLLGLTGPSDPLQRICSAPDPSVEEEDQ